MWVTLGAGLLTGCGGKDGDPVLFSLEDDRQMGEQTAHQVDSIYAGKILDRATYPVAYQYIDSVRDVILASDKIRYKDEFTWEVKLINDETLNAFATPGGHIYFYTGLIKYLNKADHFAGVMGHEIAHADRRHTSQQLQRQYGISVLLSVLSGGNPGLLSQIAAGLVTLKYSRGAESEADAYSVEYLQDTQFACNGAAGFFEKLIQEGQGGGQPEFLSTHPNPDNRVADINQKADQANCSKAESANKGYMRFQNSIQ